MIVGIFDGIIKKFNEKFPRQGVKKFDKITAVNGKVGTANEMRRTEDAHLKTPEIWVDLSASRIPSWWFQTFFFGPYLGKIPILTTIFQVG